MDYPVLIALTLEPDVSFHLPDPFVVRESLRKPGGGSNLCPGNWLACNAQHLGNCLAEILVCRCALSRPIPIRALAGQRWTDLWLYVRAAARNPFVSAPFATEPHHSDWNARQRSLRIGSTSIYLARYYLQSIPLNGMCRRRASNGRVWPAPPSRRKDGAGWRNRKYSQL